MAAVITEPIPTTAGARRRGPRAARSAGSPWARRAILIIAGLYFLVPLYAAFRFAIGTADGGVSGQVFASIPSQDGFVDAITLTGRLALLTLVITLVLVVPTAVWVHLRMPRLRRLLEGVTLLPIIIPPVVLIIGVLEVAPSSLKGSPDLLALVYVVLAMPFAYRALDSGLQGIPLKTLVEASRSLGAGWLRTLVSVLLPNLRSALLSAVVLTVAMVFGEYTMASLDQYQTFPVWIVVFQQANARVSVAVSLLALLGTWALLWLISLVDRRRAAATEEP
jgi:putative spermidine/putrescine transport system permease protein